MDTVLTLIAATDAGSTDVPAPLAEGIVAEARQTLNDLGGKTTDPDWLAPGVACDIPFTGIDKAAVRAAMDQVLQAAAVDFAVLDGTGRRKALLLADMDSTIVTGETLDELAVHAGLGEKIAAITARSMAGELDFGAALRERVAMLKELDADALARTMAGVELTPGAATLARTMAANGAHLILISGGFRYFTGRIRDRAGFHVDIGNDLEIVDGKLTGRLVGPLIDRASKRDTLLTTAAKRGLNLDQTMAVGDGANDCEMIEAAGLGVGFRGKPVLAKVADVNVRHADLTALLYLQGYRAEDIIHG